MVEVQNLVKRYGDRNAVDGLSFTVEDGQVFGLLGPNGAGKSTTMNIMTGYLAPTQGRVLTDGLDGIDPQKDLSINQSIDFGSTAAAFSGGQADYTIEFEPSATALETENAGYVVASLGVDSGYVPYTAYSAKTSYLNANPNIIQKFANALQKGMDFVQSHTPEEIAKVIAPQFKETDLATITTIVSRYYEQDTWKSDLIFKEESFNLLQDILESSGELKERVPYEELVTTTFAEKAANSSR